MFSRSSILLEEVRFQIAQMLGHAADPELEVTQRLDHLVATVRARFLGRELCDEQQILVMPRDASDHLKFALNHWLEDLDAWSQRLLGWGLPWRFRVQTVGEVVRKVYHLCPHLRSSGGHQTWLAANSPGMPNADLRIWAQVQAILQVDRRRFLEPGEATHTLMLLHQLVQPTLRH